MEYLNGLKEYYILFITYLDSIYNIVFKNSSKKASCLVGGLEVHFLRRLKRNIDGLQILMPMAYANLKYGKEKVTLVIDFCKSTIQYT